MSVISATRFVNWLDRWGVDYVSHSRWDRCLRRVASWHQHQARRGSNCAVRPWNAHGIAIHHTGGPTSWAFVWDGRSNVPGPLYTGEIYEDGTLHLTGWRITNNVGSANRSVVDRVLNGDMPTSGGNVSPGGDNYYTANSEFYGFSYRGTTPNAAQRETMLLVCAAVCSAHNEVSEGWDGGSVAGHKELTRRKPDPRDENMSEFRRDLNRKLAEGPEGDMPSADEVANAVVDKLMRYRMEPGERSGDPGWDDGKRSFEHFIVNTHQTARITAGEAREDMVYHDAPQRQEVRAVGEKVDQLPAAIAQALGEQVNITAEVDVEGIAQRTAEIIAERMQE